MVEFKTAYYSPLDRGYNPSVEVSKPGDSLLAEPVIPIRELGQTVVESDPRTGAHILQNINAAIRAGAGNIQIVLTTPTNQPIGGRPKAYGREVREAIRETTKSAGVVIEGVEMPTSTMSNLSGYDPQRGVISEQKRQQDMEEVRDAIKFVADIAGGGEVDIWSQEFPRTIFDQKWAKDEKGNQVFHLHPEEHEQAIKTLVDSKTGRIIEEIRLNQEIFTPKWETKTVNGKDVYVDYEGNELRGGDRFPKFDKEENKFILEKRQYKDFEREALEENEKIAKEKGIRVDEILEDDRITTAEAAIRSSMDTQIQIARGWAEYHKGTFNKDLEELKKLKELQKKYKKAYDATPEEERIILKQEVGGALAGLTGEKYQYPHQILQGNIDQIENKVNYTKDMVIGQLRDSLALENRKKQIVTPEKFAKKKTIQSYAELGINAMNETEINPKVTRPIFVGPEIGWPFGYGGHPDEFIEIVKKSREEMVNKLTGSDYNMDEETAKVRADRHIKGLFDTSHLSMWLNNFRRKPRESEDDRLKEFNKWYMDQVEKLGKSGTVGAIQAVDSASGMHAHLPPGQGIFPIVEAVNKMRKLGYKGPVVSEGHEEERFGAGRILMQTWNAFGSPLYTGDVTGLPMRFPDIHQAYHQQIQPPYFIRQDYAPDQREWTLWSQAPLE